MHLYAFGSLCRGEIDKSSDVDILAIVSGYNDCLETSQYSVYSYDRIIELWEVGNPFAWHLSYESKMIFSSDGNDFLKSLKLPNKYTMCREDCQKFYDLYLCSMQSILSSRDCLIFDLSSIFLAIRNFATCYSLGIMNQMNFSRNSAVQLGEKSLNISQYTYDILVKSRILSTRGKGSGLIESDVILCMEDLQYIRKWMNSLLQEVYQ